MPSVEILAAFAAATLVFAYMPGPALLYTAAQTVARGRRAGLFAAAGLHVGCYAHVFAAAFGLSAVFAVVPTLYTALKILGAMYLVWLGWHMIHARGNGAAAAGPVRSPCRAFIDSVLVEVLNPKVAVFFIAFLPQFVDPSAALPVWAQFLILGTIVNITFTSADLITVAFASAVQGRLSRSSCAQGLMRWIGGSLLIGLGVRLATDRS